MSEPEAPAARGDRCQPLAPADVPAEEKLPAVALRWLQQVIFDECSCAVPRVATLEQGTVIRYL